jgi:predicted heme/steroid binding protein
LPRTPPRIAYCRKVKLRFLNRTMATTSLLQTSASSSDIGGYVLSLISSPTNIILFIILLYVIDLRLRPRSIAQFSVISDEPIVFTYYTPQELSKFDGRKNKRILMGICGRVYDVTAGGQFYGPGGPYGNFAGRDASRGLSKGSFDDGIIGSSSRSNC